MGGGKGPIDHYVTPVKAGRVILEVAGHCEFFEVFRFLFLYIILYLLIYQVLPILTIVSDLIMTM